MCVLYWRWIDHYFTYIQLLELKINPLKDSEIIVYVYLFLPCFKWFNVSCLHRLDGTYMTWGVLTALQLIRRELQHTSIVDYESVIPSNLEARRDSTSCRFVTTSVFLSHSSLLGSVQCGNVFSMLLLYSSSKRLHFTSSAWLGDDIFWALTCMFMFM